jgi:molybdate transport system substrate-binding protein
MTAKWWAVVLLGLATFFWQAAAQEITIAAAADLSSAFAELTRDYQRQTGTSVRLSFGSSGNLTQQIKNGAPFDLFFSADEEYPKQLMEAHLAEGESLYRYAVGRLILWVPTSSALDLEHQEMNVLLDSSVKKIAIANPQHAPYGRAAVAALRHFHLYDKVADRLVFGENVSQAAQFVESGNAQAGVIALSQALAPPMKNKGRYWEVPTDAYPELDQGAVVLSRSQHKKEAAAFLAYLKTSAAQTTLRRYGFALPQENH